MLPYLTALFVLFWRWNGVGGLSSCALRATTKKGRQLFLRKKCNRMTWLEDFLTSKWPGSFTALAPPRITRHWPHRCNLWMPRRVVSSSKNSSATTSETSRSTTVITVTEALVLCPLLEDWGRITESIRILVPVDRMKQKCFQITTKQVRRSSFSSVGSLFHARGATTEKALSPIRRRVRDEVATRWSAQCRSTWNIGNRC